MDSFSRRTQRRPRGCRGRASGAPWDVPTLSPRRPPQVSRLRGPRPARERAEESGPPRPRRLHPRVETLCPPLTLSGASPLSRPARTHCTHVDTLTLPTHQLERIGPTRHAQETFRTQRHRGTAVVGKGRQRKQEESQFILTVSLYQGRSFSL